LLNDSFKTNYDQTHFALTESLKVKHAFIRKKSVF